MNAKSTRRTAMVLLALISLFPALSLAGSGVSVSGAAVSGSTVQVRVINSDAVPHSVMVRVEAMTANGLLSVQRPANVGANGSSDVPLNFGFPVLSLVHVGVTTDGADPY